MYLLSIINTAFWQPYVKHYAPNMTDDYGGRVAALWLERSRPCNAAVTPLKARRGRKGRQLEFVRPTGLVLGVEVIERLRDFHRIHHHLRVLLGAR